MFSGHSENFPRLTDHHSLIHPFVLSLHQVQMLLQGKVHLLGGSIKPNPNIKNIFSTTNVYMYKSFKNKTNETRACAQTLVFPAHLAFRTSYRYVWSHSHKTAVCLQDGWMNPDGGWEM